MAMTADVFLRRAHRALAIAFLLSVPPAGIASAKGGPPTFVVYLPLFPLFGLALTGIYLLVKPWIDRLRARRASRGRVEP